MDWSTPSIKCGFLAHIRIRDCRLTSPESIVSIPLNYVICSILMFSSRWKSKMQLPTIRHRATLRLQRPLLTSISSPSSPYLTSRPGSSLTSEMVCPHCPYSLAYNFPDHPNLDTIKYPMIDYHTQRCGFVFFSRHEFGPGRVIRHD